MKFREFIRANLKAWNKYLRKVFGGVRSGNIKLGTGVLLYPNIALFTETDVHYILELFGAKREFDGLVKKTQSEHSTLRYLYQFDSAQEGPLFEFRGRNISLISLAISRDADYEAVNERFHFSERWPTRINIQGGEGAPISFHESFESCFLDSCLIVNRRDKIYRAKSILHARIVDKKHSKQDYLNDLFAAFKRPWRTTRDLFGVHFIGETQDESYVLSGQFANVFLLPGLRETTIGEFLDKNPGFLHRAFRCEHFLYNKMFEWKEGNPNPDEKYIQPDLMIQRDDGYYNICDLKTAALTKQRITKGEHRRRRFIDYVDEGLSQLANYADYFRYEKNKEYAKSKHDVKVDNPNLFLIVGSYENAGKDEIEEASRKLKPQYSVIDYDTLNALFLSSFATD